MHTIATLGSHSCLQILKGAKEEGFATLAIATKDMAKFYRGYSFIDQVKKIAKWRDFFALEKELIAKNVILVPHGSFVAYLGLEKNKKMKVPTFGSKNVLDWEQDRKKQRQWLIASKIKVPHEFKDGSLEIKYDISRTEQEGVWRVYYVLMTTGMFSKVLRIYLSKMAILWNWLLA